MNHLFPYDNIVIGILILTIGFGFHWIGQLVSILNWDFATKIGIQESKLLKEYKVYEHAIAVSDTLIGWVYGIAAIGLFLDSSWGYKLTWFPGVILLYHSLNFWFWTRNRRKDGNKLVSDSMRIGWSLANFITGTLAILIAWTAG
jgi:hypothetical protein